MPQTASTLRVSREAIARTREYARRIDGVDSARRREVCTGHTAGFFPETTCDDPSHCATIDRVRESNQCIVRSMLFMGMSDVLGVVDLELFHTAAAFAGAVAIDAIVLTVCDFEANAQLRRALRWAFWVTLAHWILAAAGLSGLWTLRMGLPSVAPVLQVDAAFRQQHAAGCRDSAHPEVQVERCPQLVDLLGHLVEQRTADIAGADQAQ